MRKLFMEANFMKFSGNIYLAKRYISQLPEHWKILGIVTTFGGSKSAFVVSDKGIYYKVNKDKYTELNQSLAQQALDSLEMGMEECSFNLDLQG